MHLRATDFKSVMSTIPSLGHSDSGQCYCYQPALLALVTVDSTTMLVTAYWGL